MSAPVKIAVIGMGEDARLIAAQLKAAGAEVTGFDSNKVKFSPVPMAATGEEAVSDADIVFSINSPSASIRFAQQLAIHLKVGALYCDLNAGNPALKRRLSQIVPSESFVDVALMQPMTAPPHNAVLAVAGPGASRFMALAKDLGINASYVSDVAGDAATRALLISVLKKSMAAASIDFLWAAKQMGLQDWAITELKREFELGSPNSVLHMLAETQQHAKRLQVEMADISQLLSENGYQSTLLHGVEATLTQIVHSKKVPFAQQ